MRHYRIIFLLLSSFLLSSCAYQKLNSYKKKSNLLVSENILISVVPPSNAVKYKASIDVLNKHFTGLIVIKQTDESTKHLVFVTELGMRMFDFEMKGDSMYSVFVFDALNNPKIIPVLIRNFRTILLMDWFNNNVDVVVKSDKEALHLSKGKQNSFLIVNKNKEAITQHVFYKQKKETKTVYSENYNNIKLKQYGLVKLYIELDKIND